MHVFSVFSRGVRSLGRTALLAAALLPAFSLAAEDDENSRGNARKAMSIVPQILAFHFQPPTLDAQFSKTFYKEFFEALDPQKSFFLAEDIEKYREFDAILPSLVTSGNLSFPSGVQALFLQRVRERFAFVQERLKRPFDTGTDAVLEVDRKDAAWCRTPAELDALWEKRLLNSYLNYEIMNESLRKEKAQGKKQDYEFLEKTSEQRIADFYNRLLRDLEGESLMVLMESYLGTYCRLYDPHTTYMSPATVEEFEIAMTNKLSGIGATLSQEDQFIRVTALVKGGPAALSGKIKKGDRIVAVRQEEEEKPVDIVDMPLKKALKLIRGTKGTKVMLTLVRAGEPAQTVEIVRDEIKLEDSAAQVRFVDVPLPKPVQGAERARLAIVNLPAFYYQCAADVRECVEKARAENAAGMVFDLRFNGGGSLDDSVKVAGLFIGKGAVVQQRQRSRYDDTKYIVQRLSSTESAPVFAGPLVVLVDDFSASASEIVAACLQDYGRAVIVGSKQTHGKGSVQTVVPLAEAVTVLPFMDKPKLGSVKVTIAKFYRVNGGSTQMKGVASDIAFPTFGAAMEEFEADQPHAMPWDEIAPAKYSAAVDVRPWIPQLQERSRLRTGVNPLFQAYASDVAAFAAFRKTKVLSLNKAKRLESEKAEKEWIKKMQVGDNLDFRMAKDEAKEGEELYPDVIMFEAQNILADMIALQSGETLP